MATDSAWSGRSTRRAVLRSGALAGALSVGGVSFASSASADAAVRTITECTTIEEDGTYELANDLSASGDCLKLDNPDVTLLGNGHTLRGDGRGAGIDLCDSGFLDAHDLHIRNFETGIRNELYVVTLDSVAIEENTGDGLAFRHVGTATCTDCTFRGNGGAAIDPAERSGLTLVDCELRGNDGDAVETSVSNRVKVRNCTVEDNGGALHISPLSGRRETEVVDSVVEGSDGAGIRTGSTDGPRMDTGVPIRNCEIRDNDGAGIRQTHSFLDVRNCTLAGNRDGLRADGIYQYRATLRHNNIVANDDYGVVDARADERPGPSFDAVCNYWGHPTGPDHEDNPRRRPKGQPVSDGVEFVPWSVREIRNGEGTCVGGKGRGGNGGNSGPGSGGRGPHSR